jgi:hypothetical protein
VPRATFDVDVLTTDDVAKLDRFFAACEAKGFEVPVEYRRGWGDRLADLSLLKVRLFAGGRAVTVDVFVAATPFQKAALDRRCEVTVPSRPAPLPVVTAADLLLFKLLARRPKDRLDVQNVLAVQGVPDEPYLREQARRLGIVAELDAAIEEARRAGES